MPVQLFQWAFKVWWRAVIWDGDWSIDGTDLGIIATVVLKHVAQGLHSFGIHLVKLANEGERRLEVTFEREQLFLIFEADHGHFCTEMHVSQGFFVAQCHVRYAWVEALQGDAWHLREVITLISTCELAWLAHPGSCGAEASKQGLSKHWPSKGGPSNDILSDQHGRKSAEHRSWVYGRFIVV